LGGFFDGVSCSDIQASSIFLQYFIDVFIRVAKADIVPHIR
jgi:hypothetical protein